MWHQVKVEKEYVHSADAFPIYRKVMEQSGKVLLLAWHVNSGAHARLNWRHDQLDWRHDLIIAPYIYSGVIVAQCCATSSAAIYPDPGAHNSALHGLRRYLFHRKFLENFRSQDSKFFGVEVQIFLLRKIYTFQPRKSEIFKGFPSKISKVFFEIFKVPSDGRETRKLLDPMWCKGHIMDHISHNEI